MKLCAVLNCGNSTYHLQKWMGEWCPIHKCNFGTSRCVCDPPFKLFPFPTERKNPKGRQEWIDLINRSDLNTGESWAPKSHSRVCSKHFPDGRPTAEHPNPIENLILEPIEKPKRGKTFQSRRKSQVPRSLYRPPDSVVDVDIVDSESDSMEFNIENQNGNENNICKNDTVTSGAIQNLGLNRTKAMEEDSNSPAVSNPGTPRSEQEVRATPPPQKMIGGQPMHSYQQQLQQQHMLAQIQGSLGQQSQSKYTQLLAVIEDMGKDIRPTYSGSKMSAERLKRGIVHARILVRECLMECERSARN